MTEQEFIEKWRGNESGFWVSDACALFWARAYNMPPNLLAALSADYLKVAIENRAPCSEELARRSQIQLDGSTLKGSFKRCEYVHELENALSFVTEECRLVEPVFVAYVLRDGEGFMHVRSGSPDSASAVSTSFPVTE